MDVRRIRYDLVALTPTGEQFHLNELLRSLFWEEQPGELAVRLKATLHNRQVRGTWLHQLLPPGVRLQLNTDWGTGWQEIVRGQVLDWDYRTGVVGELAVTAYDALVQLSKSRDDRCYPEGTTGRAVITDIARAWQIPLGVVGGPDSRLARQLYRADTLADMILTVLEQTRRRGGGGWIVRSREGLLDVVRPGDNRPVYHLGADSVVEGAEDRFDLTDLVTRVKVVGAEDLDDRRPVIARMDGRTEFGVLQEIVSEEQFDTPEAATAAAREILRERGQPQQRGTVTAADLPFLRRGDTVHISAGTLQGYYTVAGVSHDAGLRRMTLEVTAVD